MSLEEEIAERNRKDGYGRRSKRGSAATATEENSENSTQQIWRENPEINAKIDQYIAANPERKAFWESQTDRLVRQALLKELTQREVREQQYQAVQTWMKEDPAREQEVLARVRHVPEERRQAAIISVAGKMAGDEGIKSANKPKQAAGMKV